MPWWSSSSLVQELGDEEAVIGVERCVPVIPADVPGIDRLTVKTKSSALLVYSAVNVLYGYAYAARLYNGEHLTSVVAGESAEVMLEVSESLGCQGVFTDVSLAIGSCLARLERPSLQPGHFVSREFSIGVVDDVCKIVRGASSTPSYPSAALADCQRVFHAARKAADRNTTSSGKSESNGTPDRNTKSSGKPDRNTESSGKSYPCVKSDVKLGRNTKSGSGKAKRAETGSDRKRYYAVEKKLEYLLSWCLSNREPLLSLLPSLELESCQLSTELATHSSQQTRVHRLIEARNSVTQQAPLIEEL